MTPAPTSKALLQKRLESRITYYFASMHKAVTMLGVEKTVKAYASSLATVKAAVLNLLEVAFELTVEIINKIMAKKYAPAAAINIALLLYPK